MVSDISAGDGKMVTLFLLCGPWCTEGSKYQSYDDFAKNEPRTSCIDAFLCVAVLPGMD